MLITVLADKGAPGVTTTALTLASHWPTKATLIEADPAGADLPYRLHHHHGTTLSFDLGLTSYAMARRTAGHPNHHTTIASHSQPGPNNLPIMVGPAGPEQSQTLTDSWHQLATDFATTPDHLIVDCGRYLSHRTPTTALIQRSAAIVVVVADTPEGMAHLRHAITTIAALPAVSADQTAAPPSTGQPSGGQQPTADQKLTNRLHVVVISDARRHQTAITETREVLATTAAHHPVTVAGALPIDPKAVAALPNHATGRRHKTFRTCATALATTIHHAAERHFQRPAGRAQHSAVQGKSPQPREAVAAQTGPSASAQASTPGPQAGRPGNTPATATPAAATSEPFASASAPPAPAVSPAAAPHAGRPGTTPATAGPEPVAPVPAAPIRVTAASTPAEPNQQPFAGLANLAKKPTPAATTTEPATPAGAGPASTRVGGNPANVDPASATPDANTTDYPPLNLGEITR